MSGLQDNTDMTAHKDIKTAYQALIDSDAIHKDEKQAALVEVFYNLQTQILNGAPQARGVFDKFTRFFKPQTQKPETKQGLYLYGGVGRGKSFLMDLFFETLPVKNKTRVHFHDFMLKTHDALHKRRQQREKMQYHKNDVLMDYAAMLAQDSRVICFDEIHVKDITDAMILGRLFTALLNEGVYVVFTSNFPVDDLYKDGLQRDLFLPFLDVLKKNLDIAHIQSDKDYRLNRAYEEGTWFHPLTPEAQDKMRVVFSELTAGKEQKTQTVSVKGREIVVKQAAGKVAWFDFKDLCEQPRGAADYLALSAHFDTILLANIPQLNDKMRNETRRFIILIDTLYECGTYLIVSAAEDLHRLYEGEQNAFEFQRTVSRLTEMQSQSYWQEKT